MATAKKEFLMDIVLIRLLLIGLLIIYHAFAIHTNSWRPPYSQFEAIAIYNWFGMLTHIAQLEAMVFISGLLLGYQTAHKPGSLNFHSCVIKKSKRILLPCIIFGIIYYILFYDLSASPITMIYRILNGCGHLWFLPMIFWCFVFTYFITTQPPPICYIMLTASLMVAIINPLGFLPFGLGSVGNYFLYFYMGFCIKQGLIKLPSFSKQNISLALFLFATSFIAFMLVRECWQISNNLTEKIIHRTVFGSLHVLSALTAIFCLYGIANKEKVINYLKSKPVLITLSGYCYGVYIYQQFILQILYYKTSLPLQVNIYWLPWVAAFITLVVSVLLCHLTLKFKWGRFLIG